MSGEEISVLSLEGRYYNCRERGTIMILDTLRLTFTANGQTASEFFILQLYYNSF